METTGQSHSNLLRKTPTLHLPQEDYDLPANPQLGSTFKDDWIVESSSVSSTLKSPTASCASMILGDFEEERRRIVDDLPVEVRRKIDGIIKRYKTQEEQLNAIECIVQGICSMDCLFDRVCVFLSVSVRLYLSFYQSLKYYILISLSLYLSLKVYISSFKIRRHFFSFFFNVTFVHFGIHHQIKLND